MDSYLKTLAPPRQCGRLGKLPLVGFSTSGTKTGLDIQEAGRVSERNVWALEVRAFGTVGPVANDTFDLLLLGAIWWMRLAQTIVSKCYLAGAHLNALFRAKLPRFVG